MNRLADFIKLIQIENMKLYLRPRNIIICSLILLSVISTGVYYKIKQPIFSNWKSDLQQKVLILEKQQQAFKQQLKQGEDTFLKFSYDENNNQLALLKYAIQKNIPYNVMTQWGFVKSSTGMLSLVTIFVIILAAEIVSYEFSSGTIKLLLIRPHKRWKILLSKYVCIILTSCALFLLVFIISFITGLTLFGTAGVNSPDIYINNGVIYTQNIAMSAIQRYLFELAGQIMFITFAFMLSTVFRSSTLSIVASILSLLVGSTVVSFLSNHGWAKYILFTNISLSQYLPGSKPFMKGMTLNFSLLMLAIYFIIFNYLSLLFFTKRDIVS